MSDDEFQPMVDELMEAMGSSVVAVTIYNEKVDAKLLMEVGAMILLDKPIIVVAPRPGERLNRLPRKLVEVADAMIYGDMTTEEGRQSIATQVAEIVVGLRAEGVIK